MSPRARFYIGVAVFAAAMATTARLGIEFRVSHLAAGQPPLNAEKQRELDAALSVKRPKTRQEALDFALDYTARSLRFALDHPTSYRFESATREGNCIEYAYLFAKAFNAAAKLAASPARAYAVRSDEARVVGAKIPLRGFDNHDWVLVDGDGERLYVDPTLYDAHLGWSVAFNVKDKTALPAFR